MTTVRCEGTKINGYVDKAGGGGDGKREKKYKFKLRGNLTARGNTGKFTILFP